VFKDIGSGSALLEHCRFAFRLLPRQLHLENREDVGYKGKMRNDWQDIATAPKDGRHILISDGEFVFSAFWGNGPKGEGFYDNSDGIIHYEEPILWRPLPFPSSNAF